MDTLQTLWDRLNKHDWYYSYSDDHSVWQRGEADWKELTTMAAAIDGGPELKSAFSAHYYTGEPWGNEKQPKPERPEDAIVIPEGFPVKLGNDHCTELKVLRSAAGFYIGRSYFDTEFGFVGPYSRESDYFPSAEAAQAELESDYGFEVRDCIENNHAYRNGTLPIPVDPDTLEAERELNEQEQHNAWSQAYSESLAEEDDSIPF